MIEKIGEKSYILTNYFINLPTTDKVVTVVWLSSIVYLSYKLIAGISALITSEMNNVKLSCQKSLLDEKFQTEFLAAYILLKKHIFSCFPHNNWVPLYKTLNNNLNSSLLDFYQKINVLSLVLSYIYKERPADFPHLDAFLNQRIFRLPPHLTLTEVTIIFNIKSFMLCMKRYIYNTTI